ncbi:MAG: molybdopterin-dependent oxidoreductase [Roseiflexaceae bacterium]
MPRRPSLIYGALIGGLTSLPTLALLYLGQQMIGLPFIPFDLFDWLARVLPGGVVTAGIDMIVKLVGVLRLGATDATAKQIEELLALALFIGIGIVLGAAISLLLRRRDWAPWEAGAVGGGAAFLLVSVIELAHGAGALPGPLIGLAALLLSWGATIGTLLGRRSSAPTADHMQRRAFILRVAGGALALAAAAWGAGWLLRTQDLATGAEQPLPGQAGPTPGTTPQATPSVGKRTGIQPAPGTRPEVTSNTDFYRIDINLRPPSINGASWRLEVAGLFDRPRPLTLAELMGYPAVTQLITLSCISNQVGGDLISTSAWSGVRLRDLLQDLGMRPQAQALVIQATDGFYESVSMQDLLDPRTLLVYGMNGQTLPMAHGYPLRIYIPNRYGMKQPKWITRIEAIDHAGAGYWVDRGWSQAARPQIVSVIDAVAQETAADGRIPVGGIAWAGDRGIQQVEVQVDDGAWAAAMLLAPPLDPLTWVLWRYEWSRQAGRHTFRVRATDGTGALQIAAPSDPHPDGANGYHMVTVAIS